MSQTLLRGATRTHPPPTGEPEISNGAAQNDTKLAKKEKSKGNNKIGKSQPTSATAEFIAPTDSSVAPSPAESMVFLKLLINPPFHYEQLTN